MNDLGLRLRETRSVSTNRGLPQGNKHKAHRAQKHAKKCANWLSRGTRRKNRDRRMARIIRGFRSPGAYKVVNVDGRMEIHRAVTA